MEETTEQLKENAITEKVIIPKIGLETGKEIDPLIVITKEGKKIGIYFNKIKVYRILDMKNQIEGTLDIFLVDTIKELLKNLAEREESAEQLNKEGGKNESTIRKSDRVSRDDRNLGSSRTKTSTDFV